ncbi:MAG: Athe_2463 domain-containing protein [Solirubrobacterales bacterium]
MIKRLTATVLTVALLLAAIPVFAGPNPPTDFNTAVKEANDEIYNKSRFENYFKSVANGNPLSESTWKRGLSFGGVESKVLAWGSPHGKGNEGQKMGPISKRLEWRYLGYDRNGEKFTNPAFPHDEFAGGFLENRKWIPEPWNEPDVIKTFHIYQDFDWDGPGGPGEGVSAGLKLYAPENTNGKDIGWANIVHILVPPTEHTWGMAQAFHRVNEKDDDGKVIYKNGKPVTSIWYITLPLPPTITPGKEAKDVAAELTYDDITVPAGLDYHNGKITVPKTYNGTVSLTFRGRGVKGMKHTGKNNQPVNYYYKQDGIQKTVPNMGIIQIKNGVQTNPVWCNPFQGNFAIGKHKVALRVDTPGVTDDVDMTSDGSKNEAVIEFEIIRDDSEKIDLSWGGPGNLKAYKPTFWNVTNPGDPKQETPNKETMPYQIRSQYTSTFTEGGWVTLRLFEDRQNVMVPIAEPLRRWINPGSPPLRIEWTPNRSFSAGKHVIYSTINTYYNAQNKPVYEGLMTAGGLTLPETNWADNVEKAEFTIGPVSGVAFPTFSESKSIAYYPVARVVYEEEKVETIRIINEYVWYPVPYNGPKQVRVRLISDKQTKSIRGEAKAYALGAKPREMTLWNRFVAIFKTPVAFAAQIKTVGSGTWKLVRFNEDHLRLCYTPIIQQDLVTSIVGGKPIYSTVTGYWATKFDFDCFMETDASGKLTGRAWVHKKDWQEVKIPWYTIRVKERLTKELRPIQPLVISMAMPNIQSAPLEVNPDGAGLTWTPGGNGRPSLLVPGDNPEYYLVVAQITNPNPFDVVAGPINLDVNGWYGGGFESGKTFGTTVSQIELAAGETRYVLINMGSGGILANSLGYQEGYKWNPGGSLAFFADIIQSIDDPEFPESFLPGYGYLRTFSFDVFSWFGESGLFDSGTPNNDSEMGRSTGKGSGVSAPPLLSYQDATPDMDQNIGFATEYGFKVPNGAGMFVNYNPKVWNPSWANSIPVLVKTPVNLPWYSFVAERGNEGYITRTTVPGYRLHRSSIARPTLTAKYDVQTIRVNIQANDRIVPFTWVNGAWDENPTEKAQRLIFGQGRSDGEYSITVKYKYTVTGHNPTNCLTSIKNGDLLFSHLKQGDKVDIRTAKPDEYLLEAVTQWAQRTKVWVPPGHDDYGRVVGSGDLIWGSELAIRNLDADPSLSIPNEIVLSPSQHRTISSGTKTMSVTYSVDPKYHPYSNVLGMPMDQLAASIVNALEQTEREEAFSVRPTVVLSGDDTILCGAVRKYYYANNRGGDEIYLGPQNAPAFSATSYVSGSSPTWGLLVRPDDYLYTTSSGPINISNYYWVVNAPIGSSAWIAPNSASGGGSGC